MGRKERAAAAVAVCSLLLVAERPEAQTSARATAAGVQPWVFTTSPALDLWYHGLALAGVTGFGAAPLYDPDYPARVRTEKRAVGAAASRLEREAPRFRRAFEQDSAFEILHFLPLGLPVRDAPSLIRIVRSVARNTPLPATDAGVVRAMAAALAAALPGPAERQWLGEFADALEEEWRTWLQARTEAGAVERAARAGRAAKLWRAQVEPRLASWLRSAALDAGTVLLAPALGREGRIAAGDPANRQDNLVAVADAEPQAVVSAVLRETCYPAVRAALTRAGLVFPDRAEAARLSDHAATRCGAILAARVSDDLAGYYQAFFAAPASGPGGFTLPPALEAALLEEIQRRME